VRRPRLRVCLWILLALALVAVGLAIKIRVGLGPVIPTPPLLSARPTPDALLFRDVSVFTGTDTTLRRHQDVLVRAGRIAAVEPTGQPPPDGAEIVDGAGRTLLPGYIDAHTHISGSGAPPWAPRRVSDAHNLEAYAYAGVTTTFVLGGMAEDLAALEASMAREQTIGPRLLYTHLPITAPGGHPIPVGKELMPWPLGPVLASMVPQIADRAAGESAVADTAEHNVHFIKAIVDSLPPGAPAMNAEALAGLAEATHRRGFKLFVHIGTIDDALLAVRAGADVLAHGMYRGPVTTAQAEEIARSEVPVIFTLGGWVRTAELARGALVPTALDELTVPAEILDSLRGEAGRAFAGPGQLGEFAAALLEHEPHWYENVRVLHAAGVPLLVGTDSPLPGIFPGSSYHVELTLLAQAGVPNGELLLGATSRAADVLGLDAGRIAAGATADLVLVRGDPVADIAAAAAIEMVLARGRILERRQ
jgi:imidazolonepropionase-like amidohydrolase